MEQLGSHYGVLLHDAQLRRSLIGGAEQPRPCAQRAKSSHRVRRWLAQLLIGVAARLEPTAADRQATRSRQAVVARTGT